MNMGTVIGLFCSNCATVIRKIIIVPGLMLLMMIGERMEYFRICLSWLRKPDSIIIVPDFKRQ